MRSGGSCAGSVVTARRTVDTQRRRRLVRPEDHCRSKDPPTVPDRFMTVEHRKADPMKTRTPAALSVVLSTLGSRRKVVHDMKTGCVRGTSVKRSGKTSRYLSGNSRRDRSYRRRGGSHPAQLLAQLRTRRRRLDAPCPCLQKWMIPESIVLRLTRASVASTFSVVRSLIALSRFGMLDGFAYQSPPPSYCRRAMVSLAAGAGPNEVRVSARSAARGRSGIMTGPPVCRWRFWTPRSPRQPAPRRPGRRR